MTNLFQRLAVAGLVGTGLAMAGVASVQAQSDTKAGAATEAKPDEQPNPVVARVNGKEIFFMDVMSRIQDLPPQFRNQPMSVLFPTLVSRAVDEELLSQAAAKEKVDQTEFYRDQLEAFKVSLSREALLRSRIDAQINDETLKRAYDRRLAETPPAREVHARHILLKTEDDAKAVIAELDKGADFADLARKRSTGPSGASGGDLGFFRKERMVPEFSAAAFAMKVGTHSKTPVKTQFGWHVIKVVAEKQADAPKFEQLRPELTTELQRKVVTETITGLREGGDIELFNIDGSPQGEPAPANAEPKK